MLDSITYKTESKVVAVTKEIEKTITPDKVTEMYDKVRKEVENTISRAYLIQDNELKGVVFEVSAATRMLMCRFTLNGKEHIIKTATENTTHLTPSGALQYLKEHYADAVAFETVTELARVRPIKL